MAELILTEEEKKAVSCIEWDDAALGKSVKALALHLKDRNDKEGFSASIAATCATMLAGYAADLNAETSEIKVSGAYKKNDDGTRIENGDWYIYVSKNPIKPRRSLKEWFLDVYCRLFPKDNITDMIISSKEVDGKNRITDVKVKNGYKDGTHLLKE